MLLHVTRLALVGLIAVTLRIVWIGALGDIQPVDDGAWYLRAAHHIAEGDGYIYSSMKHLDRFDGHPTAYWPVGYPAFLGGIFLVTGASPLSAQMANVMLGLISIAAVYSIALVIFDQRIALVTASVIAIYPEHIIYTALPIGETLYATLLLTGLAFFVYQHDLRAGLAFGLATLTKSQTVIFPALLYTGLIFCVPHGERRTIWRRLAISYVMLAIIVVPWITRNWWQFKTPIFVSTNGGLNLYIGHSDKAFGGYFYPEQLFENEYANEAEFDQRARNLAWDHIKAHPTHSLKLIPAKLLYLWGAEFEGLATTEEYYPGISIPFWIRMISWIVYLSVLIAGMVGAWRAGWCNAWPLVAVVSFLSLMAVVFFGTDRFHAPAMPLVIMFAVYSFFAAKTAGFTTGHSELQ